MRLHKEDTFLTYAKEMVLIKFPVLGSTMSQLYIEEGNLPEFAAAETDGKIIRYSREKLEKKSVYEQTFVLAHEILHVEFNHLKRMEGKNPLTWNIATDAVINQILEYSGLPIPEGMVNMPEASNKSAEEVYEFLMKNGEKSKPREFKIDNHSKWNGSNSNMQVQLNQKSSSSQSENEKTFIDKNEEMRDEIAENARKKAGKGGEAQENLSLGKIENKPPVLNWREELRKNLNKTDAVWSYRRACRQNYYCARLEDVPLCEKTRTEVLLDTSGSVSEDLIRSFLSQLKIILRESDMRVACFSEKVYPFVEIKTEQDVENFVIFGRNGTSIDSAIKAFSNNKEVNKIIFTDGCDDITWRDVPCDKRNILWIVYSNPAFVAKYGKVKHVTSNEIREGYKNSKQCGITLNDYNNDNERML